MKPRIAITVGDPAGIGPEIVAKALRDPRVSRVCRPIVFHIHRPVRRGGPSRLAGRLAIDALDQGLACVQGGFADALVTAPVSKEAFQLADYGFPGHTEWLADRCRVREAAMLMVSGPVRAILMTRHVPLGVVPKHLTRNVIVRSAMLGHQFLQDVAPAIRRPGPLHGSPPASRRGDKTRPRIVLCGLNPHAGDHGLIGHEEQAIFRPAIRALRRRGIRVDGPLSADAVFPKMAQGRYDLALAAYHDQGMIPVKLYDPSRIVNVTLGLPFVRTSPGHGTAYDIAGRNKADPGPMIEAILLAAQYSQARGRGDTEAG